MQSWSVFKHAVGMVFSNLGASIKVTGILSLISFAASFVLLGTGAHDQAALQVAIENGTAPWGQLILYFLIAALLSIWAVVGWHRYVLLGETPAFLPAFRASEIVVYIGKSLLLIIILIPVGIMSGLIAGAFTALLVAVFGSQVVTTTWGVGLISSIGAAFGLVPTILVGYRLSPLFPAAALGRPMRVGEAWATLKGKDGMLLALAVISAIAVMILSIPFIFLPAGGVLSLAYSFVTAWLQLTIGASIVTTLYGVSVEGREVIFE